MRLTRRRYGSRTFCWAEVSHNGEWLDLGDPWPSVTPKREELTRCVREELALVRSHYHELVGMVRPLLEAYRDDLFIHDRRVLIEANGLPYLHWTRETGTMLTVLYPHDHVRWPLHGQSVPYLFGFADRDKMLRDESVAAEHSHNPTSLPTRLCLHFNGKTLREITTERAVEIIHDHQRSVRHCWDHKLAVA